jgi:hypothetical protein
MQDVVTRCGYNQVPINHVQREAIEHRQSMRAWGSRNGHYEEYACYL